MTNFFVLSPFVMAAINTRVVRRSNALADYPYGRQFEFNERMLTGDGGGGERKALTVSLGSGVTPVAMALKPLRKLAARVLPSPGEGPSPEAQ